MADIRLVSALSRELPLLVEALDVEDAESSVKRELVLCKLEICMIRSPYRVDFSGRLPSGIGTLSY
jgi:hypothetical protein